MVRCMHVNVYSSLSIADLFDVVGFLLAFVFHVDKLCTRRFCVRIKIILTVVKRCKERPTTTN